VSDVLAGERTRALPAVLTDFAPAKINLTLRVIGRRSDGYHELESLVAFADIGDRVSLRAADALSLSLGGPTAKASGALKDNLVLKAACAFAARFEGIRAGRFTLTKALPVAAGLGGGSSDAAAALRLLARLNGIALDDARLFDIAARIGADVPVCLDPRPRVMRGIGDELSQPLAPTPLPTVLVNPRVAVPTKDVFARLAAMRGNAVHVSDPPPHASNDNVPLDTVLEETGNDLEAPAIALQPVIAEVLAALGAQPACRRARMSGSGATCFALFPSTRAAAAAARALRAQYSGWWVRACVLNRP
jgi:4-diphosphocytidyl-2-C-methyl-D-erythritol kinase